MLRPRVAASLTTMIVAFYALVSGQVPSTIDDPEAYGVYAALLQREAARDRDFARDLRLLQETRPPMGNCGKPQTEGGWQRRPENGWQSAIANFWQANARKWLLEMDTDLGVPYLLITPAMLAPILRAVAEDPSPRLGGGPEPGLRMLPARYVALSAVGFNGEKTSALVGIERGCDSLHPLGDSVVCSSYDITPWERVAGKWVPSSTADSCGGIA